MRIRTVKPEFWAHPVFGNLDDQSKWIAIALLNVADDEGYFLSNEKILRGQIAPYVESLANFSRSLAVLSHIGWFEEFSTSEMGKIGRISNWHKHQKVDHPKSSKLKTYIIRENFSNVSEKFELEQGTGNREQGTGKGFIEFQMIYPEKASVGSPETEREFRKALIRGNTPESIVDGAKKYDEYLKAELGKDYPYGKYVCQAYNFLEKDQFKIDWLKRITKQMKKKTAWSVPANYGEVANAG